MRIALIVFTLALGTLTSGCFTLIGSGIGAAVPKYETVDPSELPSGTEISAKSRSVEGIDASGTLVSSIHGDVIVADGLALVTVPSATVRRRIGSESQTGLYVGLAIDVALLVVGVIAGAVELSQHPICISICGGLGGM